jgi:FixJ family two-component response regulator
VQVLQERYESLTRREREVMEGVVVGRLNKRSAPTSTSAGHGKAHRGR